MRPRQTLAACRHVGSGHRACWAGRYFSVFLKGSLSHASHFHDIRSDEDFSVLGAVRKKRCGGVPCSTPHKPLCSVTRSGREKIITLSRRPLQFTSGKQVDVQVEHRLPGIGAIVLYQAEATFGQPTFVGQLASYPEQVPN